MAKPLDISKVKSLRKGKGTNRKTNTRAKRNAEQREIDLALIAQRLLRGDTLIAITTELNAARPYTLDRSSIGNDVKLLNERWRAAAAIDTASHRGVQLAKLDFLESKCHMQIATFDEGREVVTKSVSRYSKRANTTTTLSSRKGKDNNLGHWLHTLRWCMEQKARILGLYAPLRFEGPEGATFNLGDVVNSTQNIAVSISIQSPKTAEELSTYEIRDALPPPT